MAWSGIESRIDAGVITMALDFASPSEDVIYLSEG